MAAGGASPGAVPPLGALPQLSASAPAAYFGAGAYASGSQSARRWDPDQPAVWESSVKREVKEIYANRSLTARALVKRGDCRERRPPRRRRKVQDGKKKKKKKQAGAEGGGGADDDAAGDGGEAALKKERGEEEYAWRRVQPVAVIPGKYGEILTKGVRFDSEGGDPRSEWGAHHFDSKAAHEALVAKAKEALDEQEADEAAAEGKDKDGKGKDGGKGKTPTEAERKKAAAAKKKEQRKSLLGVDEIVIKGGRNAESDAEAAAAAAKRRAASRGKARQYPHHAKHNHRRIAVLDSLGKNIGLTMTISNDLAKHGTLHGHGGGYSSDEEDDAAARRKRAEEARAAKASTGKRSGRRRVSMRSVMGGKSASARKREELERKAAEEPLPAHYTAWTTNLNRKMEYHLHRTREEFDRKLAEEAEAAAMDAGSPYTQYGGGGGGGGGGGRGRGYSHDRDDRSTTSSQSSRSHGRW